MKKTLNIFVKDKEKLNCSCENEMNLLSVENPLQIFFALTAISLERHN